MCDLDSAFLIAEFRKAAATFRPMDVLKWNGTSWDYLSITLSSPDVSKEDHKDLVKFARNAMVSAAGYELGFFGVIPMIFKWGRRARSNSMIEAMASIKMPPEPGPTDHGEHDGVKFEVVPGDEYRLQRRRAITAKILLGIEKNRDWRATSDEFEEIARQSGARVDRASA